MSLPKFFERKRGHVSETQSAGFNKTVSFVTLRIDPIRDAIRDEPRFKALSAKDGVGEKNAPK